MEDNGHNLTIFERERIDITKAIEVVSSTDKEIFVKLEKDVLRINGESLKINKLIPETQVLSISGKINGVNYISKLTKKSLFKKVFK